MYFHSNAFHPLPLLRRWNAGILNRNLILAPTFKGSGSVSAYPATTHTANTIHADIKPANILLDTSASGSPFARFADFSTAFVASSEPSSHSGGGTWSFMSPEQLSRDPSTSTPSFSSDVYALGVTLLSFLCGGNPFRSMLDNGFRLREAVKMGDAMSWAMQEPEFENRIEALQKLWTERGGEGKILSLVACALRKKKEDRFDAEAWCGKVDAALAKLKKVDIVGLGITC
ncbi:kinase-like protein [Aureobasidium subglaciale]|nr:kinase-like protein [Aureobasidium subglaciale]